MDRDPAEMPDAELMVAWRALPPTNRGSSPEEDRLAAEIERRGPDI